MTDSQGGQVLLRCTSPVGKIACDDDSTISEVLHAHQKIGRSKLCSLVDEEDDTLALTAENHVLFLPGTTQLAEVKNAIFSALICADELEEQIFETDDLQEGWSALGDPTSHAEN